MIRRALLLTGLLLCCISTWADPKWKSVAECDAGWNAWADKAMPKYRTLSQDYETLNRRDQQLQEENQNLQSSVRQAWDTWKAIVVFLLASGIGVGVGLVFMLVRFLKRARPWSAALRQLLILVAGAIWMSLASLIAINDDVLSKHPVNMLFTVLVYSIPALAFGGIGFWWFGRQSDKGQAAHV